MGRRVALYRRGANIGLKEMYKTPSRVEGLANVFCAGLRWNVAEKCFVGVCGAFFSSEMGLVRAGGRSRARARRFGVGEDDPRRTFSRSVSSRDVLILTSLSFSLFLSNERNN